MCSARAEHGAMRRPTLPDKHKKCKKREKLFEKLWVNHLFRLAILSEPKVKYYATAVKSTDLR